ncbi:MAG: S-methyl-5'-thioadenosine phosphorylase [Deltaproteobacteria bacterium]|nr:S-methyl-5'-thioadenosine phosphorylase [Deltaproteobacteria bacterium]
MLGVIGGSGLYDMPGLSAHEERRVETPYGAPSDAILLGKLDGKPVAFLPRHGRGHKIPPHEINFRANIVALKTLGCTRVLSLSAVGSMKEAIHPGDVVVVDQFIDRTRQRPQSFFTTGLVGHVALADPVCAELADGLYAAAETSPARAHKGGTYLCVEGPQFSTRAESHEFRSLGVAVIGMTNAPEYKLAREAGLCYATLALATDYDCWHEGHDAVTVEQVIAVMKKNVANAQAIVRSVAAKLDEKRSCSCAGAGARGVITSEKDAAVVERLRAILG